MLSSCDLQPNFAAIAIATFTATTDVVSGRCAAATAVPMVLDYCGGGGSGIVEVGRTDAPIEQIAIIFANFIIELAARL